ncbi:unnamed protein product [Musa textilis]
MSGGATAPDRRFHRLCVCAGAVLPPQAGRFHRPRLGGSTAPGLGGSTSCPHSDRTEWGLFRPQLDTVVARWLPLEF